MSELPPIPAVQVMRHLGLEPDPWQIDVLESTHPRLLLNCSRQAGKSTVVAILGLAQALYRPGSRVLLVSRSHRQAKELLRLVAFYYQRVGEYKRKRRTVEEIELESGSRIVCVPCKEETIRGFAKVDLLVIDEAARVPDDIYRAVRPMLAVSRGRLICLSTPYGKRGFFYDAWARGGDDWARIEIPATQIPRISAEFLTQERRGLGESWFRQEYGCSFEALEGLVYPDFARCVVAELPADVRREDTGWQIDGHRASATPAAQACRRVGGLDFGFRNPFAAIWGLLDRDGILWLTGEHYARQKPLSHHVRYLPREVRWYADPAGATERAELRCAGFEVVSGDNSLRSGIAAVSARLEAGTLRVLKGRCPNLLAEAELYRYGEAAYDRRAEAPVDEHNHALAALRYLISRLDARRLGRPIPAVSEPEPPSPRDDRKSGPGLFDESAWTTF